MAELLARWKPGIEVPAFAKTAVLAGRFVKIVDTKTAQGDYQIGHCVADDRAFGVAQVDSAAVTEPPDSAARRVSVVRQPAIARVKPGAAFNASTGAVAVKVDANGCAIPWATSGAIVGYALHSCAGTDDFVEVELI
jgi:hypothetical protein